MVFKKPRLALALFLQWVFVASVLTAAMFFLVKAGAVNAVDAVIVDVAIICVLGTASQWVYDFMSMKNRESEGDQCSKN